MFILFTSGFIRAAASSGLAMGLYGDSIPGSMSLFAASVLNILCVKLEPMNKALLSHLKLTTIMIENS